jgi:hypothetical protein
MHQIHTALRSAARALAGLPPTQQARPPEHFTVANREIRWEFAGLCAQITLEPGDPKRCSSRLVTRPSALFLSAVIRQLASMDRIHCIGAQLIKGENGAKRVVDQAKFFRRDVA